MTRKSLCAGGFILLALVTAPVGVTIAALAPLVSLQQVIVFADGTEMAIQSYEVRGRIVQFTTMDGSLRSVPSSYVNLEATEARNGGSRGTRQAPAPPPPPAPESRPAPVEPPLPVEAVQPEPEPMLPVEEPPEPAPAPPPEPMASTPPPPMGPPAAEWANDDLKVSLAVPSSDWHVQDMPPSFDVAVTLTNPSTEARATLGLVRGPMRGRNAFLRVVDDVASTIEVGAGYQEIESGEMMLEPYHTYEFRFWKSVGFDNYYNRLVVFYSRDLAYVLSLTCPEARADANAAAFEALVRGLVIRKSRGDLSF
jgi:hypothetical protein